MNNTLTKTEGATTVPYIKKPKTATVIIDTTTMRGKSVLSLAFDNARIRRRTGWGRFVLGIALGLAIGLTQ